MDNLSKEYKDINRALEEYYLESDTTVDEGFNKLISVKFADPKLQEALILLHSKYVAEMEAIRKYHFKYMNKLVITSLATHQTATERYLELMRLIEEAKKVPKGITVPKIFVTVTALVFLIGSIFYMFTIDTKAGEMLLELLKAAIDGFVASGKNTQL